MKFAIFTKSSLLFNSLYCFFLFINKTLRLDNLKTKTAMNAKVLVFVICVEAIKYLLLYNLHDCTFDVSFFSAISVSTKYLKSPQGRGLLRLTEAFYCNWTIFVRHLFTEWWSGLYGVKKWVKRETWKAKKGSCMLTPQLGQIHM